MFFLESVVPAMPLFFLSLRRAARNSRRPISYGDRSFSVRKLFPLILSPVSMMYLHLSG